MQKITPFLWFNGQAEAAAELYTSVFANSKINDVTRYGEGAPVAAFLCLEYAGRVGLYNSGFDPARAQLAPGIVLLAHVIRDAIERGVPVFDFLRGEEPYKYGFGPSPEDVFNVKVTA